MGLSLIPLSLVCIVANALLLVPQGKTTWTDTTHLSLQVWLMAGFLGGGLMVSGQLGGGSRAGEGEGTWSLPGRPQILSTWELST